MNCPACQTSLSRPSTFCPECGAALSDATVAGATEVVPGSADATRVDPALARRQVSRSGSAPASGAEWSPGTLLANRYRIVGLLGRGGMGDVYRADDLTLGQSVALKFLPADFARDESRLQRFYGEARIAREASHPNLCRVYDIGDVEGRPFLSMEYVDGEDLRSLLRRIGRLPQEKAVDLARQLCAGLAALHDQGVLHRDLKPANVMLDGRGRVRITDFGLAGLAAELEGGEVRSGTPAYMAPEQLSGQEVTERSDIYSLGLVLYELFTGRPAFEADSVAELSRLHQSATPSSVTSHVSEIDPAVDRVIARCLQKDPAMRPASAIALSAALPGGDPLAAALAAGETPSPEMVAASGGEGAMHPALALACAALLICGVVFYAQWGARDRLYSHVPLPVSPTELRIRAADLTESVGYPERFDTAHGFGRHGAWSRYIADTDSSETRWQRLNERPRGVLYWYRSSPDRLDTGSSWERISPNDPPFTVTGMTRVLLEPDGTLYSFRGMPPESVEDLDPARSVDWSVFFTAASLDLTAFQPAEPEWIPSVYAEERLAWTGAFPDRPEMEIRVEAGAIGGLPTYWHIRGPWASDTRVSVGQPFGITGPFIQMVLFLALLTLGFVVAWRNLRQRRGDVRGATRLAVFIGILWMLVWVFRGEHTADPNQFTDRLFMAMGFSALVAGIVFSLYLALEPWARRLWPQAMVAWTRLLHGNLRDPLVGRSILIGGVMFFGIVGLDILEAVVRQGAGYPEPAPRSISWNTLMGAPAWIAQSSNTLVNALILPMITFIFLVVLRAPLRRAWLANLAFVLVITFVGSVDSSAPQVAVGFQLVRAASMVFIFTRFGFLPIAIGMYFNNLMGQFPVTMDTSAFYAGASAYATTIVLGLGAYGLWSALAGRSIWSDPFAD